MNIASLLDLATASTLPFQRVCHQRPLSTKANLLSKHNAPRRRKASGASETLPGHGGFVCGRSIDGAISPNDLGSPGKIATIRAIQTRCPIGPRRQFVWSALALWRIVSGSRENPEVIHQFPNSSFPTIARILNLILRPALRDALDSKLRNIVPGAFTRVLAKHSKHLNPVDILAVGVDRMQRSVERDPPCGRKREAGYL